MYWILLIVLLVTLSGLYMAQGWQNKIIWMAVQYFAVFLLVAQAWPTTTAAAKLLTGWMSLFVISGNFTGNPKAIGDPLPRGRRLFYGGLSLLTAAIALYAAFQFPDWLPNKNPFMLSGGLMLISVHTIQVTLHENWLDIILGLFGFLAGFEIIYAAIETSLLLNLILSSITLLLALVGSYMLNKEMLAESGA